MRSSELEKQPEPGEDVPALVLQLRREWEAAREQRDFALSDALRARLRALGVNPGARDNRSSRRQAAAQEEGFQGCSWAEDFRYDAAWGERAAALHLVSAHSYLVSSPCWALSPRLRRYMTIPTPELKARVARALGGRIAAVWPPPETICVEKPFLAGFAEAFGSESHQPFVLLAINGGDDPVTREQQAHLAAALPGLRACFATNLHVPENSAMFHPLPIGLPGTTAPEVFEEAVARVRASMPSWEQRDPRLLLAPMKASCRLRGRYQRALSAPKFSHLVHIVNERLPLGGFLALLASHRAALSPPGRGYDCYRTWQALAVGCVPLVTADPAFDGRLYHRRGPVYIPQPEEVTPCNLQKLLEGLTDPSAHWEELQVEHWKDKWTDALLTAPS